MILANPSAVPLTKRSIEEIAHRLLPAPGTEIHRCHGGLQTFTGQIVSEQI